MKVSPRCWARIGTGRFTRIFLGFLFSSGSVSSSLTPNTSDQYSASIEGTVYCSCLTPTWYWMSNSTSWLPSIRAIGVLPAEVDSFRASGVKSLGVMISPCSLSATRSDPRKSRTTLAPTFAVQRLAWMATLVVLNGLVLRTPRTSTPLSLR